MAQDKLIGVYKIYCEENDKTYIGSSNNIDKRLKEHLNNLKKNQHKNPNLQRAFNKYGLGTFTFSVVAICPLEERFNLEQYYIDNTEKLFNAARNVVFNKGGEVSEATRLKISEVLKKRCREHGLPPQFKNSGSKYGAVNGKAMSKKVIVLTEEGSIEFESISQASRELGIGRATIVEKVTLGVICKPSRYTKVIVITEQDEVEYPSMKEASIATGYNRRTIRERIVDGKATRTLIKFKYGE